MKLPAGNWRTLTLWTTGVVLVMALFAWAMRTVASEQLQRDAERAALSWASYASSTVPDLDEAFEGRGLSPDARAQLKRLRRAAEVFRFKLFDRDGRQILVSDELDAADAAAAPLAGAKPGLQAGNGSHAVPPAALSGRNHVVLKRESRPDRPAVYSEAYVPVVRDGRVLGIVEVYVDQVERAASIERAFTRIAAAVAVVLAVLGAIAGHHLLIRVRQQRQTEARMRYLAQHDVLSGSLNRASFQEALQQAGWRHAGGGPAFALLCVDLDRFKDVNDSLGHAAGDEVLRQAAQRLHQAVRHGDHVARLGGDEFAVLQTGVSSATDVSTLAERVVTALAAPYELAAGARVHCGASVGAAIHGVDAATRDDLLHKADLALYRAKSAGRGTFSFYDAEMDEQLQSRRSLVQDLRDAVDNDQMSLHFQPLFESDGRTLVGYEALLRWHHPTRGNVPPSDFIPLAEDSGSIDALSRWVLRRACADAATWPAPLSVAVNLSPAQFRNGDLVNVVTEALSAAGLPAKRLELEITESLLMSNTEHVLGTLRALSAMGVRIAMDDFGTGYSSLAYLWRFPFDKVKIDRAFTRSLAEDPKVNLIVRSIISLAHSLDIRVNAEGVETSKQMSVLQQHGCDELQGFFLGRPGPLAAIACRPEEPRLAPAGRGDGALA